MVHHVRAGAPDLPCHAHERRLFDDALEPDTERPGRGVHPIEAADKIDVPPVAPELAIGDRLQSDRFLQGHDLADAFVFDRAERGAIDLSSRAAYARVLQLLRAQETPDVIGAKGRCGGPGHRAAHSKRVGPVFQRPIMARHLNPLTLLAPRS